MRVNYIGQNTAIFTLTKPNQNVKGRLKNLSTRFSDDLLLYSRLTKTSTALPCPYLNFIHYIFIHTRTEKTPDPLQMIYLLFYKLYHYCLSKSDKASSSASTVYFSCAHSPKSINRQRRLQNGRYLLSSLHSTGFWQVGHFTVIVSFIICPFK